MKLKDSLIVTVLALLPIHLADAGVSGDGNCDGKVNGFDVDALVLYLTNPAAYAIRYPGCDAMNLDMNADGRVDSFDVDGFVQRLSECGANQAPDAQASANPASATVGQVISFSGAGSSDPDGNIVSYAWAFGDGGSGNGVTVSHAYASAGVYSVTLSVTDSCGKSDSATVQVSISQGDCNNNQAPTANAGPDQTGKPGVAVAFDGSQSFDPDGSVTKYWWNYGDGASSGWLTTPIASHSYGIGVFTAKLWVKDNCGTQSAYDSATITVSCAGDQAPTANAGPDQTGSPGQTLTFDGGGSSDDFAVASYLWDFGGGVTKAGKTVTNSWTNVGTYSVTLTVTDSCGQSSSDPLLVTIAQAQLKADFKVYKRISANPDVWAEAGMSANDALEFGVTAKFDGSFSRDAAYYEWELAPGVMRWGQVLNYDYQQDGSFQVRLTVYDAGGTNSNTVVKTVYVKRAMRFLDGFPYTNHSASDIAIEGNTAWVSQLSDRLTAVNISNPSNLSIVSELSVPSAWSISTSNGVLGLAAASGLRLYQAQLPTPVFLGSYDSSASDGQAVYEVEMIGRTAFLAAGPAGFKVLSLVNPSSPQLIASYPVSPGESAIRLRVSGGRAYTAEAMSGKIHILDVSGIDTWNPAPQTISKLGTLDTGSAVNLLAVGSNGLLAVDSQGSFDLYDASNPSSVVHISTINITSLFGGRHPSGLLFAPGHLYATSGPIWEGYPRVARFDLLDPANPLLVEWLHCTELSGVNLSPVLRNGVLFIGNSDRKLATVDVPE